MSTVMENSIDTSKATGDGNFISTNSINNLIGFMFNYLSILELHSRFCSLNGCENNNNYLSIQSHPSNCIPRI